MGIIEDRDLRMRVNRVNRIRRGPRLRVTQGQDQDFPLSNYDAPDFDSTMANPPGPGGPFWRPTEGELHRRFSYPVAVPVIQKIPMRQRLVRCWVLCRIVSELTWDEDGVMGTGWSFRVSLVLLDRISLKALAVLYYIESRQVWTNARGAYRRGSVDAEALFKEVQGHGVQLKIVEPYLQDWMKRGSEREPPLVQAARATEGRE